MQRVSLLGHGKTTRALTKFYPHAVFYDDMTKQSFVDENGFEVKPASEFDPSTSDLEIVSPGIAPTNVLVQKAKNLISEYDVFANTPPLKIWISGTNGKTTTTQMMQHLLEEKGSFAGGNIGTPLSAMDPDAALWILETSSFTMHYTRKAAPNLYILLPVTPDHLSWHSNMQAYVNTKLKPLSMMREGEIAIIPEAYKEVQSAARLIPYKDANDLARRFGIDREKIIFKGPFLLDALLAMAAQKILFDTLDYEKINTFVLDPHRQEEFQDVRGRLWVNDTKATNPNATIAALERYAKGHIRLILGGDDKGVDLGELFISLQKHDVSIYAIGSNKKRVWLLAQEHRIACQVCDGLTDAVEKIDKDLAIGEVALLSPAAASLDEFSSYAHRGELFKKSVKELS